MNSPTGGTDGLMPFSPFPLQVAPAAEDPVESVPGVPGNVGALRTQQGRKQAVRAEELATDPRWAGTVGFYTCSPARSRPFA